MMLVLVESTAMVLVRPEVVGVVDIWARSDRRPQVQYVRSRRPLRRLRPHRSELLHMVGECALVGARRNLLERKCSLLVEILEAPQRGALCLGRQRPQL